MARRPSRPIPRKARKGHPDRDPSESHDGAGQTGGRRGRQRDRFQGNPPTGRGPRKNRKGDARVATDAAPVQGVRFSSLLMVKARTAHPDKVGPPSSPEPLALLDYEKELELKNQALQEFWTAHALPDKPNRVLPSPKPRHYRVTTKRRVTFESGRFRLDFQPEKREAGQARLGAVSLLEPKEHSQIYAFLVDKLNTEAYAPLGRALNFLVIRGDYHRFAVFFNVDRINAQVARKAKLLADHLEAMDLGGPKAAPGGVTDSPKVSSAYLFHDPGRSPFYLSDSAPEGPWKIKRLFGPETVRLRVGARTYSYRPTAFCQVNASIVPAFLEKAEQLLKPRPEQRLLDLYCGFGLFGLHLQDKYREVLGIDAAGPAIDSARDMARAEKAKARFTPGRIRAANLPRLLPATDSDPESILLDPPRHGVEPGVIRELAARKPVRVLHVFCDMDTLPREVNQWRKAGYMIAKVIPLDMFPGTDNLEVMVAFIPDQYGILNRIEAPARNPL